MYRRDLARKVMDFEARVREHPADAVGSELDRLVKAAKSEVSGSFVAQTSPVAELRWMNRQTLLKTKLQTQQEPIEIPYGIEIVGFLPTILLIDTDDTLIEPPPEAIDVFLQINRRDTLTARNDQTTTEDQDAQMVNLPGISCTIGNNLFDKIIGEGVNSLSVKFGWAVPLALVDARGWGDVQVSLVWMVNPLAGQGKDT